MGEDITLPPVPESVAEARRWTTGAVASVAGDGTAEVAALLVSELVSNVVLHARTPCDLSVVRRDGSVRVAVRDGSERMPRAVAPAEPTAMSGRGMLIVAELADAHGVEAHPGGGKSVWFELHVPAVELR
ncbi:MAG: ATP-binding protein [Actinobacteria bacterium]|nr:ATP-binding protein [Actinomycetota bacterium]